MFVGVDEQDLTGPATKFMKRFDITYPVIADDGPLIGHYGVTGYPETFFIDKHGRVIPLPPNATGQVGHIIGAATPALLDLGIRTALAPVKAAAMKPFAAVLAILALVFGLAFAFRSNNNDHPTQIGLEAELVCTTCHEPLDSPTRRSRSR